MSDLVILLWARRLIVLTALFASLLGGLYVAGTSQPRYLATARVSLDYLRPDPITGETVNYKMADAYVKSQVQTIRDYQVAVPAAEALGWLDNPDFIAAYESRPATEKRDIGRWAAARIIRGTTVHVVPESNLLEIGFRGDTPEAALVTVEAIRNAYIKSTVDGKREAAARKAAQLEQEVARLGRELEATRAKSIELERANGLALSEKGEDLELLQARRQATASTPAAAALDLPSQAEFEARRAAVSARRPIVLQARLLRDELAARDEQLSKVKRQIAELRSLALNEQSTISPVGTPEAPRQPIFPNWSLIIVGSGALGLIAGALLAFLTELLSRRIRTPNDLVTAAGAPLLGVIPETLFRAPKQRRGLRLAWVRRSVVKA